MRISLSVVALCALSLSAVSCDEDGGAGMPDLAMSAPDLALDSDCGHPGDVGNSVGVGRFCTVFSDCASNTKATLCARIGNPKSYFCTFACTQGGAVDQCGEGARCECQGAQCGCYPNACGGGPDAG